MPDTAPHRESLRVLLDGNWWIRGPISNREVMREITFTWARLHPEDSLTVAVPLTGVKTARQELAGLARVVSTRLRPQGISTILELALLSLRLRPDITLAHNFTPLLGRSAVFIQDFLFLSNPEWFTRTERAYFSLMPLSVRRANVVIASSVAESERIVRTSAAPRAVPVGLGLNRAFAAAEPVAPAGVDGLDGFLLAVGRLTARKNLATTIEAALASGALSPSFPLLVVGEASGALAEFPPAVRAALDDHLVRLLGRIETEELRWLYENAALFLFLTLDEGFGLPTLEALACRTPILASDIPVFREILGERARLVDPRDVPAIAASIRELVANPPQPPDPTPVLEYYSWDAVVTRLRAAITEVLP
ncbi:glycosyltransferase family 1 protein [Rathayibacter rathayi]|nr:glycosyltransferase family 1 protein [Rathayibacter rathayi]PPG90793.1 glycosyltransferase family 1 protein [Rathayibacter rathayi]